MSGLVAWIGVALAIACVSPAGAGSGRAPESTEVVVLLHGLGRSNRSMRPLEEPLQGAGYDVRNVDYPSTDHAPEALVETIHASVTECCAEAARVHFVTHSLGGILTRAYVATHAPPNLGRVVMLAPPNHGSEYVDALGDSALFEWALGPTATQLGTSPHSLPNRLPPPSFELGVIAGHDRVNPVGGAFIPGDSDGTVSVESTRLDGMADFLIVPSSHTFIMRNGEVARQVVHFLQTGRFLREDPEPDTGE